MNKTGSWAQTLFAGSNSGNSNVSSISNPMMSDHNTNENTLTDSASIAAYNQQATNAVLSLLNIHVCCIVIHVLFNLLIVVK